MSQFVTENLRKRARVGAFLGAVMWPLVELMAGYSAGAATVGEVLKKIQTLAPAQRRASLEEGAKSEGKWSFILR